MFYIFNMVDGMVYHKGSKYAPVDLGLMRALAGECRCGRCFACQITRYKLVMDLEAKELQPN